MIEIRKIIDGYMVDNGNFDIPQKTLDECMSAITDARGKGGQYEICVRWLSDIEIARERKARG